MGELLWLNGHTGQTSDQLIALEHTHRTDSLVLAFEQAIDKKAARLGEGQLSAEELTVLAVEALEREVNNGGFHQFFVNSSVSHAAIMVDALTRIGCPRVAAITADAIAALRLPRLSVKEIEAAIRNDDDGRDEVLRACDQRFFEYPEPIADRLFAFIKANQSTIRL